MELPSPMMARRTSKALGIALLMLCAVMVCSCAGGQRRVHEARFQKREHRSGWHVDLGRTHHKADEVRQAVAQRTKNDQTSSTLTDGPRHLESAEREPEAIAATNGPASFDPSVIAPFGSGRAEQLPTLVPDHNEAPSFARSPSTGTEDEPKKGNPWAIPAFALALGTVTYGILGTSSLIIVALVILTLVVAAVALRKGRINELSGKGLAIGAMTLGVIAALITLIALLNGGG